MGYEEEQRDDDPGFEGTVEVGLCVAQDEEANYDEEVDDGGRVAFYVENERLFSISVILIIFATQ